MTEPKEPRAYARRGDPETSWEAADSVENIRESQMEVLRYLRILGPITDTDLVVAMAGSRQSESGIRTRRHELVELNEAHFTGEYEVGDTGRRMRLWAAGPDTREATPAEKTITPGPPDAVATVPIVQCPVTGCTRFLGAVQSTTALNIWKGLCLDHGKQTAVARPQ